MQTVALLNFALAVFQLFADAAAKGRQPSDDELAALLESDAAVALSRSRWKDLLPKKP
jgi:hypothetical protein